MLSEAQIKELLESADMENVSQIRKEIVNYALESVGQIPYYWGGASSCPGYDGNNFGMRISPDYKGRDLKGLDCSGFVCWVLWSVTGQDVGRQTTATLPSSLRMTKISADQLKPGDLGFTTTPGAKTNHVGFFVGYDENGMAKWVHCGSSTGSTLATYNAFRVYYRLLND